MSDRLAEVFEQRYAELVRLAGRILGDRAEAEDVAQEALSKLSGHPVLRRPDAEIGAWLRRVSINASFNRVRGRRRGTDRVQRAAAADRPLRATEASGPLAQVVRAEERAAVRAALAHLPERQRACLLLRHSGYRYAEIAATLDIAEGSVGVLLARGERAFRTHYEQGMTDGVE
ncbi:MAG TPA: sigma-70 family RNA polymerase sigma factor [Euzebyales bacterium]|nr:sigma-70 family RNA polymerase sigma factor [Euzebyales bacterium]